MSIIKGDSTIEKNLYLGRGILVRVNQTSHGFSEGNVIKSVGDDEYDLALADTPENAEVFGIVQVVHDANSFSYVWGGMATQGVPDEPAGTVLFLSDTTPGLLTADEPSVSSVSLPMAKVIVPEEKMLIFNLRGYILGSGGSGGGEWGEITGTLSDQTDLQAALDDKADDNAVVHNTGNENVGGVKTFTSIPVLPASDPTTGNEATRKAYVDSKIVTTIGWASPVEITLADNDRLIPGDGAKVAGVTVHALAGYVSPIAGTATLIRAVSSNDGGQQVSGTGSIAIAVGDKIRFRFESTGTKLILEINGSDTALETASMSTGPVNALSCTIKIINVT